MTNMKKVLSLLCLTLLSLSLLAQSADYELIGFVDEDNQPLHALALQEGEDFIPRVAIRNNGPSQIMSGDTLHFSITLNEVLVGTTFIPGNRLAQLTAGVVAYIGGSVLFTAEQLQSIATPTINLCYEITYPYDPDPTNDKRCLEISHPVGIADNAHESVRLYPNPASDLLNIEQLQGSELTIFNMMGKMVYQTYVSSQHMTIPVHGWPNGTYILRATREGQVINQKVVICR